MTCTTTTSTSGRWKDFGNCPTSCDAGMSAGLKDHPEAEQKLLSNGTSNANGVTIVPVAAATRANLPVPRMQTRRRSSNSILSSFNFTKNGRVKTGHVFSSLKNPLLRRQTITTPNFARGETIKCSKTVLHPAMSASVGLKVPSEAKQTLLKNNGNTGVTMVPKISRANSTRSSIRSSLTTWYRQSRFNARRIRKRVVFKHGDCNVIQGNVAKRRRRYLQDIFTTLVDAQWRWTLLVFSMNFILSWLAFAVVWYLICYMHDDLNPKNIDNNEWTPCVTGIRSFMSIFLYSVETQHTIGYGGRLPTEECPLAVFVLCIQSITGVMIQAFMVGVVFAKLSRPKKRTQTLLFSRHAVICLRDGVLCLMFRVGDMRKSHIIEAHVRAQLIRQKVTQEGEHLPFYQTELKVGGDGEEDKIFFIWPTTIVHKIDHTSPLYSMCATDLLRERFEIVVILEGVIESTGMTTQARSSYLPSEILWGHRFQPLVAFKADSGGYEVDYAMFNNTSEVATPLSSAKQLAEIGVVEHHLNGVFPSPSSNTLSSMDSMSIDCDKPLEITIPDCSITASPIPVMVTGPESPGRGDAHVMLNGNARRLSTHGRPVAV